MPTIYPLRDRVLVMPDHDTEPTAGLGLVDLDKRTPSTGLVLAAGPGRYENGVTVPPPVQAGDRVVYSHYGGEELQTSGGKEVLLLNEYDILARIEDE